MLTDQGFNYVDTSDFLLCSSSDEDTLIKVSPTQCKYCKVDVKDIDFLPKHENKCRLNSNVSQVRSSFIVWNMDKELEI
jgi:hypothetical protein